MSIDSIIDGLLFYAKYIKEHDPEEHKRIMDEIYKLEVKLKEVTQ